MIKEPRANAIPITVFYKQGVPYEFASAYCRETGWFWREGSSGTIGEDERYGPFKTRTEALADARINL